MEIQKISISQADRALLLSADEYWPAVERYLHSCVIFCIREQGRIVCQCAVAEGNGVVEIKNIATVPDRQGMGLGSAMIEFLFQEYAECCRTFLVGTGDASIANRRFYESLGFSFSHMIPDFFIKNYPNPIQDDGGMLQNMVYYRADTAYVYMLRCADGSLYTGYTTDIHRRLAAHNNGHGAKYTRSRRPCTLAYLERLPSKHRAMQREAAIKAYTREEKLALIAKNPL